MKNTSTYLKTSKKHKLKQLLWGADINGISQEELAQLYLFEPSTKECWLRELKKECKSVRTTNEPFLTRIV